MANRICIIGANGYIGRHLALGLKGLLSSDDKLLMCDLHDHSIDGHTEYRPLDILDSAAVAETVANQSYIYFLSGVTGTAAGFDDYAQFVSVNEIGLLNLLNACRTQPNKPKVIFPSTRLVYKGVKGTLLSEDTEKEFKTIYAINKFSCEQYLQMYANCFDIRYTVLRICVPYGNSASSIQSYGTLSHFVSQALEQGAVTIFGDGEQRRTLTHIEDLMSVMVIAGLSSATDNGVFNVGGADELSVNEIAQSVAEAFGVPVIHCPWPKLAQQIESGDTIFDSAKLDTLLGIRYRHTFRNWLEEISPRAE